MKVLRIDHIHYKTSEIEKVVPVFEKLLGAEPIMDADFEDEHGIHDVIFGLPNAEQETGQSLAISIPGASRHILFMRRSEHRRG